MGIVYTPIEVVDFIIQSVEYVMQQRFGCSISDKGVHVLDPFTGTGTFIVRLLRSGIIKPEDLLYKYTSEIHCNEIVLLAYYIAAVNIEETYHELSQSENYVPFEGIVLTDTFELAERSGTREGEADTRMENFRSPFLSQSVAEAAAIYKDVQPVLVVTKADLAAADMLRTAYTGSGIPLIQLNYETGEGLDEIRGYIQGHLCAFCGNSGVGKSTLLNTLAPELKRETGSKKFYGRGCARS